MYNVSRAVQIGLQCTSRKMRRSIEATVFLEKISALEIRNYRGASKSLARPRRKQANVSVRMA